MTNLNSRGCDLVRAGRHALQPTDADRTRLLGALRSRLGDAALPTEISGPGVWVTVGTTSRGDPVPVAYRPQSDGLAWTLLDN
jgi:hypothetical protein